MPPRHPPAQDSRPSPEALLAEAMRESRGRLKVFLGAAPGVGKTYEMLLAARAARAEGIDVVVGIVETHGRAETEAMLDGLEIVPRRTVSYKGRTLDELDLDAVLARRPKLVLIDELAHTNAPGSRHLKRHLDVEELIAAGIDVYTTLNIQHIESLNDVVARITRIRVRELVPDGILDRADEIKLVDLPPADLIKRLGEGKVYVRDQAQRAVRHYFSAGNLTALRELALRRTAQRVDDQMLSYMRAHAISGPWEAGERVLVCIDGDPSAAGLIRYAKRMADRLRAKWTAFHVEQPRDRRANEPERDRVAEALRLAERLGGETITLPGDDVAEVTLAYAKANNVTHIIVGRHRTGRLIDLVRPSTAARFERRAGDINLHVISGVSATMLARPAIATRDAGRGIGAGPFVLATLMVGAALALALIVDRVLSLANLSLIFMMPVLATAFFHGLTPSLYAAVLSVLMYNFFFLPPLYTLTIADPENVYALFFFLLSAAIASHMAALVRNQMRTARDRAKSTADLYAFSRNLAGLGGFREVLTATAQHIALMLKVRVVILLPGVGGLTVGASHPPEDRIDEADLAAAQWSWDHREPAGRGADTLPGARRLFVPMGTGRGMVGIVGIDSDKSGPLLSPDDARLLNALADQAAVAIERVNLARDIDRARLLTETERLRSALLTSISHDLRTPLASIIGAATTLRSSWLQHDPAARDELIATVVDEAERLNRFVGNLLDMTRLESGALTPNRERIDLADVVGTALRRLERVLGQRQVRLDLAPNLPMLKLDFILFEQVLVNLLDNAAKYSPDGSSIRITARRRDGRVIVAIADEGSGIPADQLARVFDKFHRVPNADRQRAGTGLGLAVCRGFVEALGGTITAGNRLDRSGAVFTIEFPIDAAEPDLAEPEQTR